jgi:hypothetical protein
VAPPQLLDAFAHDLDARDEIFVQDSHVTSRLFITLANLGTHDGELGVHVGTELPQFLFNPNEFAPAASPSH